MIVNQNLKYRHREEECSLRDTEGKEAQSLMATGRREGWKWEVPRPQFCNPGNVLSWEWWGPETLYWEETAGHSAFNDLLSGNQRTPQQRSLQARGNARSGAGALSRGQRHRDEGHIWKGQSNHHDRANLLRKVSQAGERGTKLIKSKQERRDTWCRGKGN